MTYHSITPQFVAAQKKYRWKKGKTGNPKGFRKPKKTLETIAAEQIAKESVLASVLPISLHQIANRRLQADVKKCLGHIGVIEKRLAVIERRLKL